MRSLSVMFSRVVVAALAAVLFGGLLSGCVQVGGKEPLLKIDGRGYGGGSAQVEPGAIPSGPEHQVCREQLGRATEQLNDLQRDLEKCKADRRKDKDKWESEKSRLEQDKKQLKDERDYYKDRLKKLGVRD